MFQFFLQLAFTCKKEFKRKVVFFVGNDKFLCVFNNVDLEHQTYQYNIHFL